MDPPFIIIQHGKVIKLFSFYSKYVVYFNVCHFCSCSVGLLAMPLPPGCQVTAAVLCCLLLSYFISSLPSRRASFWRGLRRPCLEEAPARANPCAAHHKRARARGARAYEGELGACVGTPLRCCRCLQLALSLGRRPPSMERRGSAGAGTAQHRDRAPLEVGERHLAEEQADRLRLGLF